MVAKLKFWFGSELEDIFSSKYIIEKNDLYVYVYEVKQ